MSVLLSGLDEELAAGIAKRLIAQGDEVRIMITDDAMKETWRARGVYVATGDRSDEDFVWRACGGVRTVVAGSGVAAGEMGATLIAGARRSGVDRFVIVTNGLSMDNPLADADVEWVILRLPKKKLLQKQALALADVAAAVDAADDLAGSPRLDLDLSTPDAWSELRLESPLGTIGK